MIHHLSAIWRFRYFWLSLVRLDLRNRYRRSVLGIGWSLVYPLAMTVVFCVAFSDILGHANWRTYAPFLVAGLCVWEFIKGTAIQGCDSFIRAESYIRQCPLPYTIYPLRTTLGTLIHFAITLVVVLCATAVVMETWTPFNIFWAIIPGLILVTIFSFGLATLAAFAHVYFHDTKHLFEVVAQLFFFLTPIMYPRKMLDAKDLGWLADINPVSLFLDIIRDPLLTGVPPSADQLTTATGLALATFGLSCGTMVWLQKKVIFQL
jgi:ABC-type polysaccharide/polyol phosphate export permease